MEGGEASSDTSDDSESASMQAISQAWQSVKRAADDVLEKNSLQDLLEKRNYLQNPMAMYYI
ncbi:MAG: hypothetical protein KME10_05170 [Plectolyngbya sp. WJT66-NPBG17]|jgi:DNA-binding IscR family transcriptional regulator|nr:hypothetical protein [Plectolyngbya sp. WJT66-NPBG17]MBW4524695.1 hypothetical protein [Phormidium tanganyikae FI6-MK23]